VILAPVAEFESANNAANLHFFLFFGAFWGLVWVPRSRVGIVASIAIVVAAALSDPLAAILLPVAAWRCVSDRTWRGWSVVIAYGLAMAIQTGIVITSTSGLASLGSALDVLVLYPLRVVAPALLGARLAGALWQQVGIVLAILATAAMAAFILYVLRRPALQGRPLVLTLLLASVVVNSVGTFLRWSEDLRPVAANLQLAEGPRYSVVPILLLLSALVYMAARPDPRVGRSTWRAMTLAGVALLSISLITNVSTLSRRSEGPTWSTAIFEAASRCRTLAADAAVSVNIAPPGWSLELPCARVLAAS
jgi:hypothetical protein